MRRFQGKGAIVTGSATGIGAAIAHQLAREGAQVLALDLILPTHDALGIVNHQCDVTEPDKVAAAVAEAVKLFGGLDLLVNNAGTGASATTPEMTNAEWDRVFAVNVTAVLNACRPAIPEMRKQGGGAIVNTASMSGLAADFTLGAYNASKAAVINYSRSMAIDHAAENIRVNALCPGFTANTAMTMMVEGLPARKLWDNAIPMGRAAAPEEIAEAACFLLSDQASYITGIALVVDGGVLAHTGSPTRPSDMGL